MFDERVISALTLTAFAGMATAIGAVLGLAVRKPGPKFMAFTLGLSAGVMLWVSFMELVPLGAQKAGGANAYMAFFAGMIVYFLIDLLIPHDYIGQHDHPDSMKNKLNLERTGLLMAVGIGIHNFPEGMATFAGALEDYRLGAAIAVAVAIHNIPEGLAITVPVYEATGSRRKAFLWSFYSGLFEPLGALIAAVALMPLLTTAALGIMLAAVAGIMTAISVDEIVPVAKSYESEHAPIFGIIAGMAVMAASLALLK